MNKNFIFSILLLTVSTVSKIHSMEDDDFGPSGNEIEQGQILERQAEEARNNMFGRLLVAVNAGNHADAQSILDDRDRAFSLDTPVDDNNNTLLMKAASRGDLEMVKLLTQAHATVELTNRAGQTAEHIARNNGHDEVAQYLYNYAYAIYS